MFRAGPINDSGPETLTCIPPQLTAILKSRGKVVVRCSSDAATLMPEGKVFDAMTGELPLMELTSIQCY